MEGIANQKVLVLGLGATGRSAANFCIARGASVLAADERDEEQFAGLEGLDPAWIAFSVCPFPTLEISISWCRARASLPSATAIERSASGVISNSPIDPSRRRSSR